MNRLMIMAGYLRDLAGAGRHTRDRRPAPPSMPHHLSPRFPGSGAVQPRVGIRPVRHLTKVDRSPRIHRGMLTAVSCGIFLVARSEEIEQVAGGGDPPTARTEITPTWYEAGAEARHHGELIAPTWDGSTQRQTASDAASLWASDGGFYSVLPCVPPADGSHGGRARKGPTGRDSACLCRQDAGSTFRRSLPTLGEYQ